MQIANVNNNSTFSAWVRNNKQTKKALVYAIKNLKPHQRKDALDIVRTLDKNTPNHDLYAAKLDQNKIVLYADSDALNDIFVQSGVIFNKDSLSVLKKFKKLVEKNENILKD